ncbi:MAG TPA: fumarate hydratase [Thermomicrobiales bacterium]|nr:fumarate hydratase [Thermomicrobiales bacterium]
MIREVDVSLITETVERLCLDANYALPDDVVDALEAARIREVSPLGKQTISLILENVSVAAEERVPMCQDTGTVVVFADVGQDVHFNGGSFRDAIDEGVRRAYTRGYLRSSIVGRPVGRRTNTGDNTPAVLHLHLVPGGNVSLTLLAKGGGAENMSRMSMLTPSDGLQGVIDFVVETVEIAGPNACPPVIVGVGIGGTFDSVGALAKHAIARPIGTTTEDDETRQIEVDILRRINALGIGPHGFGGRVTALAVHVEMAPTHIASLPVAVNLQCGPAARSHRAVI